MRLNDYDDDDFNRGNLSTIAVTVCVLLAVVVIGVVILLNKGDNKKTSKPTNTTSVTSIAVTPLVSKEDTQSYTSVGTLTPKDLDFFEMYPEDGDEKEENSSKDKEKEVTEAEEDDPAKDGKHTLIKHEDGSEEWVSISKYITKNEYDYLNLENNGGIMKYYKNERCISSFGVDISKDQGYVDFNKLKKAGCDFVMLRIGARGYESGQLSIDDYFVDNLRRAQNADLDIGVYFLSQATTVEEAEEEAVLVLANLEGVNLKYPVCFMGMSDESHDGRNELLKKAERTDVVRAFLEKIEEKNYKTMVYGTKEWLITKVDLIKISGQYDIWLYENEDIPTYPYEFTLWQYDKKGKIDGISGEVSFNVSFVDYDIR